MRGSGRRRRRLTAIAALAVATLLVTTVGCSSSNDDGSSPRTSTTSRTGGPTSSPSTAPADDPVALAAEAYVWGYPLVVSHRTLQRFAAVLGQNELLSQKALSDVKTRVIVSPNQDTLYSVAVLDLRSGPLWLEVPDVTDRYWTYQFLDAWTESFAYLGTRATEGKGGKWLIVPPDYDGVLPGTGARIDATTPVLFLLGRFLVDGPDDVAAVTAITDQVSLTSMDPEAPSPPKLGTAIGTPDEVIDEGISFFDELGDALALNPPASEADRAALARFASLGIGAGLHPVADADVMTEAPVGGDPLDHLAAGLEIGRERIDAALASTDAPDGWSTRLDIGSYTDPLVRAAVAKAAWGANVPEESTYPRSIVDADGDPYDGSHTYRMHFDADELPPAGAFWSLTLYGPDQFFTDNELDRFAVGDRTPGLTIGDDGSLDLYLSHDRPDAPEGNWLPAPEGPFTLLLRLYLPEPDALDGTWTPPGVERLD